MLPDFKNHSVPELISAAKDIGWCVDKKEVQGNPEAFAEQLYFQYRWRIQLSEIAVQAGTLSPEELPEIPYDAGKIQECMGRLQPKIRRTKQKGWAWLSVFLLVPIFSGTRCVLVNQSLLEAQTEDVRLELDVLRARASEQGWEMVFPDNPTWADVSQQIEVLESHAESEPMILSAMRQARQQGVKLDVKKPYSIEKSGDFSSWLKLVDDGHSLSRPFSLLSVPSGKIILEDGGMDKVARINNDLWVMNQPVSAELLNVVDNNARQSEAAGEVDWNDAVIFANAFSELFGLPPCYTKDQSQAWQWLEPDCKGFRLPTEAEWLHVHSTLNSSNSYLMQSNEWCWDMYDPSWLWNLSSDLDDPRIDSVNIGDPSHVQRNGLSKRRSGTESLASFRLVKMSP